MILLFGSVGISAQLDQRIGEVQETEIATGKNILKVRINDHIRPQTNAHAKAIAYYRARRKETDEWMRRLCGACAMHDGSVERGAAGRDGHHRASAKKSRRNKRLPNRLTLTRRNLLLYILDWLVSWG